MKQLNVLDWMPDACPIDKIDETLKKKKHKTIKKEKDIFENYIVEGQLDIADWLPNACPKKAR